MGNLREQMEALAQGIVTSARERMMAVGSSKAQTASMLSAFGRERTAMGRDLRRKLAQSTEAVATFVASLRADFAKGRADFAKAHRQMTKAQRAGLAKDRRHRSREVAELMNDFHVSRGEMAQELAESLAKSTQEIKSQVSGLSRFRASLQKFREDAGFRRQIPNSLKEGQEKTTFGEAVRHFVGKPGKPKKK